MWLSSQPLRNLTVTGMLLASFTARIMLSARSGSSIRALPLRLPAILGAGQPMLISSQAGEYCWASSAARAMGSASSPKSWMAQGISSGPISISSALLRLPCTSPLQLTISPTQATAPKRMASSRRARSETPAIGASMA